MQMGSCNNFLKDKIYLKKERQKILQLYQKAEIVNLRDEFLKTEDPHQLFDLYKRLPHEQLDKEIAQHFNDAVKKQALELYGERDPNVIYENTELFRRSLGEKRMSQKSFF
ncbi:hypothetical protein M3N64_10925 [Sporolactobacillus sp. CPB3-1]|uniref:Uncharacterized protein n=1 Tax=Sporolactobacillus mangiferae TaxID=2940498 RepID=A0ABT0MC30_9BACL|nr:hypothetical protein [Sporolactobacillus mangiferae]MCL1632431.1 hypothetical protein [Sporolactobacillus mangiferae]